MNFGKYGKATWINLMKKFSKYGILQDLQGKDNICEITLKAFDYFPFVHLIVNIIQSLHGINFKYPESSSHNF